MDSKDYPFNPCNPCSLFVTQIPDSRFLPFLQYLRDLINTLRVDIIQNLIQNHTELLIRTIRAIRGRFSSERNYHNYHNYPRNTNSYGIHSLFRVSDIIPFLLLWIILLWIACNYIRAVFTEQIRQRQISILVSVCIQL